MKDYEDEAFDELEKAQQRKVATGVTDGTIFYTTKEFIPIPVGFWVLYPGAPLAIKFTMYAKPADEQIKNTEALLGWKWEDV
jgi:hypothetical protein